MPPTLYLVRHAEGKHNVSKNWDISDPVLTAQGKVQCTNLCKAFQYHNVINLVVASPLRRAIQTAVLGFSPLLARPEVPMLLHSTAQEVGDAKCDTGLEPDELQKSLRNLFVDDRLPFDVASRMNFDHVQTGWNIKTGYWAYTRDAISARAADFRRWLWQRPERHILVVTHGAFLHFLTEDWDVDDPMENTAYRNCEVRQFIFSTDSTETEAHVEETPGSQTTRGANMKENDSHVIDEMEKVRNGSS
ncbi:phosphoglycerate mutase-like protein [Lophiostoma macrostomum CBS 122681]|uniref:Phosphoglycerate mutase-like protein n=1 Tax=Lophiostoma macrostomum CBS 122681 TaxID=1314788 RepID=A0A6A6TCB6_9PLEO|nr:phosphoglycerate mutase-like protein [Lophiostoma macrostomum CBS 122681]